MNLLDAIAEHGLLLLQDKKLANVVTFMTGERVKGSWWSHPRAQDIFNALEALPEDQVIATKLVGGKVTFVHRSLWPDLLAVVTGDREYQVHTKSGRHEKRYEAWDVWAKRMKVRATRDAGAARRRLEKAVVAVGGTAKLLPW
ncbi:MAG: hypothetical protein AABO58_11330 [Acidobacteriota bacterium]